MMYPAVKDRSPEALARHLTAFLCRYEKQTTVRTYRTIIGQWLQFCEVSPTEPASISNIINIEPLHTTLFIKELRSREGQPPRTFGSTVDYHELLDQFFTEELTNANRLSEATIKKYCSALSALYRYLQALGFIQWNPFSKEFTGRLNANKNRKRPTRACEPEEVIRILQIPDRNTPKGLRDAAILAVLFGGGLRRSELTGLTFDDIKLYKRSAYLHLKDTKANEDQIQALPKWAYKELKAWMKWRAQFTRVSDTSPVFVRMRGSKPEDGYHAITGSGVRHVFKTYAKLAGVRGVSPHSARATAITELLKNHAAHDVMKFSRHKHVDTVLIYNRKKAVLHENVGYSLNY